MCTTYSAKKNFQFICTLNETKIKVHHEQLLNTEISGYKFISQLSLSNAGGVGFFVLDHLNFIIINDFPTSNEVNRNTKSCRL